MESRDEPRPEVSTGRIETLDILRGAALVGIFIVHGTQLFCGWSMLPPERRAALPFSGADWLTQAAVSFLFADKARVLFALMFGVSFFLQLKSAERRGQSIQRLFVRRLSILLLFGLVHAHVLFGADILRYYALSGFLLLGAWRWPSRRLLLTSAVLAVGVPCGAALALQLGGLGTEAMDWSRVAAAYRSSSLADFLWAENVMALERYKWPLLLSYAAPTAGIFLLGVWLARHEFPQRAELHRARLKTWAGWGLGLGLLGLGAEFGTEMLLTGDEALLPRVLFAVLLPAVFVGHLALSLFYVCTLSLLCLHPSWKRRLSVLAPAGRMTLTNYFLQSGMGALIFYGIGGGLYDRVGPFVALLITLGLCTLQLFSSAWWLRHFQMGPLEWLWRWMLQGQRPTFRRATSAPLVRTAPGADPTRTP